MLETIRAYPTSASRPRATSITALRERVERAAPCWRRWADNNQLADLLASASYAALCEGSDRDAQELIYRAMPIARQLEQPFMWMIVCRNLGLAALLTGETGDAQNAFREELQLCRALVVRPIAEGLRGLAAVAVVAVVHIDDERAARLWARPLHIDITRPKIPWTRGSERRSSSRHLRAARLMLGTQASVTEAR